MAGDCTGQESRHEERGGTELCYSGSEPVITVSYVLEVHSTVLDFLGV